MKDKMTNSIAIALSLLISVATFAPTAHGQQPPTRFRGDTGVVTPGMGQILRITLGGIDGDDRVRVRIGWMKYMATGCNSNGVCRQVLESQGTTAPVILNPNETASFDVPGTGAGVRVTIRADTANVRATAQIINTATGEVTSHVIMANTEGDFH